MIASLSDLEEKLVRHRFRVISTMMVIVALKGATVQGADTIRVGALAGIAIATAKTTDATLSEGPFGGSAFIDYSLDDRRSIGVEHLRSASLTPVSTAVSFTGIFGKWYPYTPQPQYLPSDRDFKLTTISIRDVSPYIAFTMGFVQASIPGEFKGDSPANAVGLFVNPKGGFDYPVWRMLGLRLEGGFPISFGGTGSVTMPYVMAGFYAFF